MVPLSWSRVFPATHHSPFNFTVLIVPCHTHGLNWLNLRPWALGGQSIRTYCRFPFIEKTDGNWGVLDGHSILIHLYPYYLRRWSFQKKNTKEPGFRLRLGSFGRPPGWFPTPQQLPSAPAPPTLRRAPGASAGAAAGGAGGASDTTGGDTATW